LPTFVSRWIVYGGPFETGYLPIRDFLWNSPVFLKVLLSANHGLLSWTPVLIFSLLGLVLLARRLPRLGVPFFAATFAFYLFISIYPDWAGISSFGTDFSFPSLHCLFSGWRSPWRVSPAGFSHKRPALIRFHRRTRLLYALEFGHDFISGAHI